FFSSRRRHTRFSRDWSSDVCSSDLLPAPGGRLGRLTRPTRYGSGSVVDVELVDDDVVGSVDVVVGAVVVVVDAVVVVDSVLEVRSEERRVGKGCRCGWARDAYKK